MPKYAVSSTLRDPAWTDSIMLSGDLVDVITKLRKEQDGDIVVQGTWPCPRRAADPDVDHRLGGGGQRVAEGGTAK
jgi:hypothetical protein